MKISVAWMEELLGTRIALEKNQLRDILLDLGFEIAGAEAYPACSGVVAAEVLGVKKHPNADRLRIAQVTDGKETTEVVCGAPNLEAGQKVFWAKVGARLSDGTEIKETPIRGVKSPGMLCSARELGVGEDHSGLWILPASTAPGTPLDEILKTGDMVLEVEITPNRPDCLSQIGIARELAAALSLGEPKPELPKTLYGKLSQYPVEVQDPDDCPLYLAKKIEGVSVAPSHPAWQARLVRCGIRPINDLVDITNLVLLEIGQPLHVFDADKLRGGKIIVRRAAAGEKILALDGKTYALDPEILVIADEEKPVAIAGIMGGEETAVGPGTRNVLLESAVFDRRLIRTARKKLGLGSESSYRFERGVTRWSCRTGSARAEKMILDSAGGRLTAYCDTTPGSQSQDRATTLVRLAQVEKILGERVTASEVEKIFHRLGISIPLADREKFNVESPDWRLDLAIEADYIEEIARLRGYSQLPSAGTRIWLTEKIDQKPRQTKKNIKNLLQSLSFNEACNYGLVSDSQARAFAPREEWVELENPLSEDGRVLRPSLLPELLRNLRLNRSYQKQDIRLFETGKVFRRFRERHGERFHLAGVACGRVTASDWQIQKPHPIDFFWIKGVVEQVLTQCGVEPVFARPDLQGSSEDFYSFSLINDILHPSYAFEIRLKSGPRLGYFGLLHPQVAQEQELADPTAAFELDLEALQREAGGDRRIQPVRRTPVIRRDCSFWIQEGTAWGDLLADIRKTGGDLLEDCQPFDLYRGKEEGRTSLSFTLTFRDPAKTLDDAAANQLRDKIVAHLEKKFKAELRK